MSSDDDLTILDAKIGIIFETSKEYAEKVNLCMNMHLVAGREFGLRKVPVYSKETPSEPCPFCMCINMQTDAGDHIMKRPTLPPRLPL